MCRKLTAYRLGANADWNTHTVLNACPQEPDLNQGIWLDLEEKVDHWADEYGTVWVVCGPVFFGRKPRLWIGDEGEVPVAVPDAFFKVVVKESGDPERPDVLAFLYPHHRYPKKGPYDQTPFLVSVDYIEELTGLDLLSALDDNAEEELERTPATALWN
jgi:DNA/RNA endonuclease G (NUC1)